MLGLAATGRAGSRATLSFRRETRRGRMSKDPTFRVLGGLPTRSERYEAYRREWDRREAEQDAVGPPRPRGPRVRGGLRPALRQLRGGPPGLLPDLDARAHPDPGLRRAHLPARLHGPRPLRPPDPAVRGHRRQLDQAQLPGRAVAAPADRLVHPGGGRPGLPRHHDEHQRQRRRAQEPASCSRRWWRPASPTSCSRWTPATPRPTTASAWAGTGRSCSTRCARRCSARAEGKGAPDCRIRASVVRTHLNAEHVDSGRMEEFWKGKMGVDWMSISECYFPAGTTAPLEGRRTGARWTRPSSSARTRSAAWS